MNLELAMLFNVFIILVSVAGTFAGVKRDIPSVHPEYLDNLRESGNYAEFARLMGIDNVELVIPKPASENKEPMHNPDLVEGDMMLLPGHEEEARQGIRFEKYGGSKWPQRTVPFSISNDFNGNERGVIQDAVNRWNRDIRCVQWRPWNGERDYVNIFKGDGCWSYLGRIGNQQALSLGNGCVHAGIALHEMDHAVGFAHEHNRNDRDNYVRILWDNIPDNWKSQYERTNPDHFGLQDRYDYYSIMHYGMKAPGTDKDAFELLDKSVDRRYVGQINGFTQSDINKINEQYC